MPKEQAHGQSHTSHDADCPPESIGIIQPGHGFEIHAEDAGNQRRGHEQHGDDSQRAQFHVDPVAEAGKVDIQHACQQVPDGFQ